MLCLHAGLMPQMVDTQDLPRWGPERLQAEYRNVATEVAATLAAADEPGADPVSECVERLAARSRRAAHTRTHAC